MDLRGLVFAAVLTGCIGSSAQALEYVQSEAMIPVRDGVKLHAVILRPKGSETGEALPFLMQRTPYGVDGYTSACATGQAGAGEERLHLRLRGYSRAVRVGGAVCDESADGRAYGQDGRG